MAKTITGNFAANGDSVEFVATRYVIRLGTDTNQNFGGGTVTLKTKNDPQLDWTSHQTTYTATAVITQPDNYIGGRHKLTLASATSPDLDYSITYE